MSSSLLWAEQHPQNLYVKPSPPGAQNVTVWKLGLDGGDYITRGSWGDVTGVLKAEEIGAHRVMPEICLQGIGHMRRQQEVATYKPRS